MYTPPKYVVKLARRIVHAPVEVCIAFRNEQILQWTFGTVNNVSGDIYDQAELMHNHPQGYCPSITDLYGASQCGSTEYVVTSEGIYTVVPHNVISDDYADRIVNRACIGVAHHDQAWVNRIVLAQVLAETDLKVFFTPWSDP